MNSPLPLKQCALIIFIGITLALAPLAGGADDEADLLNEIKILNQRLDETLPPNSFGVTLTKFEQPHQIIAVIDALETALLKAKGKAIQPPAEARSTVLRALQLLYKGRGNTAPKDGTGWYPANTRGANGKEEVRDILSRGLLDDEGKARFESFLDDFDFNDAIIKKSLGFPPQFTIGSDEARESVRAQLKSSPTAKPYRITVPKAGGPKKAVAELIDDAITNNKISPEQGKELKKFLSALESSHYDKSVKVLNDATRKPINYFGREQEASWLVEAMGKLEKGHVLMTGRAGVGKTTILKMLQDHFLQGKISLRNEQSPIILELPITAVTNPSDPSAIKTMVAAAKELSVAIDRRIILYVDEAHISTPMTRNALKGFLTELISNIGDEPKVHLVLSTTSDESRTFVQDSAFSRRFTEIDVREFNREETLQLIKQATVPLWKDQHKKAAYEFGGISDDAFEYAYRYASIEQPHAGNPTGTKELLEAAISRKLNREAGTKKGQFTLEVTDVQQYIRERLKLSLVPGDPEFDNIFQSKWDALGEEFVGNEGLKIELETALRTHFGNLHKNKMTAFSVFGPPGGGKSFLTDMLAKHFFGNPDAKLVLNGGEYKNGGLELNKLIGSPTGTVGSEEQRSILSKFLKDHPGGGVIVIEEADYIHRDVIQLFTNMTTDKKFTDGLGKTWDTSKFILVTNSNIGQDLMIPKSTKNKMTWEQFNTRRQQLTEKVLVNGREVERVRPDKIKSVFEQFIKAIVTKSDAVGDTSEVAQEGMKQIRRYRPFYIMPPTKEELQQAAYSRVKRFVEETKLDHGVLFQIDKETIDHLIDIEDYEFEKGHSYVIDKLEDRLFTKLTPHLHERGKTIKVEVKNIKTEFAGELIPAKELHLSGAEIKTTVYSLGVVHSGAKNPWGDNPDMMRRIRNFSREMSQYIKGNENIIESLKAMHKQKALDWNTKSVATYLGSTGAGKTEMVKAEAKVLYGSEDAYFRISGINHEYDLNNYFRPPKGVIGGLEETEFERWFLSRQHAGGGIILFDELLSFRGLNSEQIGHKVGAINKLYDLLDEGILKIGNQAYDARGFQIRITGNALQELFEALDDSPDAERLVQKILKNLGANQITESLKHFGLDPPKVARLGRIFVFGPQPAKVTHSVGKIKIANMVRELQQVARRPVEIMIDERAVEAVVKNLTTIQLGMREVEKGVSILIKEPVSGMLVDLPEAKKIELKFNPDNQSVSWYVNGREVALEGAKVPELESEERNWNYLDEFTDGSTNRTPQMRDLPIPNKLQYTSETLKGVAIHEVYGHWMTDAILKRRNPAESISLVAGKNYLGYVRPVTEELYHINTLSGMFREAIVLQAGHRAVFNAGLFASGGGGSGHPRDPGKPASDDLGRIEQMYEEMFSNRLIPEVTEGSPAKTKAPLKAFLSDVWDAAADRIISDGVKSGEFKKVFDHIMKEKFIAREELDQLVKAVDFSKFDDPDEYLVKILDESFEKVSQAWGTRLQEVPRLRQQLGGTLIRVLHEIGSMSPGKRNLQTKIVEIEKSITEKYGLKPDEINLIKGSSPCDDLRKIMINIVE